MARQQATDIQNTFIRGLVTEATGLKFPKDACTEAWNCIFDETGRITRRPALDAETGSSTFSSSIDTTEAWTEYVWSAVEGNGDITFLVQQKGNILSFFDISDDVASVGPTKKAFAADLSAFIPSGSSLSPKTFPCKYAQGNGNLVVVNEASEPILIEYSESLDTITLSAIALKARDFVGLDDGLSLTFRPTESVSTLKTNNARHYYNLLNQGWHATDALSQWDTARTDMPSNADTVGLFRSSSTDAFDNTLLTSKSPGNSPAPKGHFILDVFAPNRTTAMTAEGYTGASVDGVSSAISLGALVTLSSSVTNPGNAFDSNAATSASISVSGAVGTSSPRLGKTLASASFISRAELDLTSATAGNGFDGVTVRLYAKTGSAPSNSTDGTLIGLTYHFSSSGTVTINSTDIATLYNHVWVVIVGRLTADTYSVVIPELRFYSFSFASSDPITYKRPSATAAFAGRIWYAGIDGLDLNNTVFFSQIIQRKQQYGLCYQAGDPTSEDFPDLLADDGGAIKIPEIAKIVHLDSYGNSLLVFATNGVWAISGGNRQYFTASNYGVRKISGIGTTAATSFISYKGLPVWWGESGIYTVSYDPNYDSFSVVSLTDETVFSFVNSIPKPNRRYVKGAFNVDTDTIIWLYNDTETLSDVEKYRYNKALEFNGLSKAFYPSTISVASDCPRVRGVVYLKSANDDVSAKMKFVTSLDTSLTEQSVGFAEYQPGIYLDWSSYGDGVDYQSYFITGYAVEGQATRFFQPSYVFAFMEPETDASCFMQGIFDWTTSGSTGKWSTSQQIYNSSATNRALRHRRLKLRGKGKAMQLKFRSETGKPFTLVGWAIPETASATT